MTEKFASGNGRAMSRRHFLRGAAGLCAGSQGRALGELLQPPSPDASALKKAAQRSGNILATYTGMHQLLYEPAASAMIAATFSMIAVGNDLKFSDRLRPTPEAFDFIFGDTDLSWAENHKMLFRGHCLIWWNALPSWFKGYVTPANARQVLTYHISTVVKHYAGRIYSWDVVNEAIYHDNRPDGLRVKPWLSLVGEDYIDLAFHTAAAADPKARLILNECYIEHDTPAEIGRRGALLNLATRLKKSGVPIHGIGVQGHLRGATPLDKAGMTTFCKQIKDLGLEIMITELDVDSVNVPAPLLDQTAANQCGAFLEIMAPHVTVITLEALRQEPAIPNQPDGLRPYSNLFDGAYKPTPSYSATVQALERIPSAAGPRR